MSEEINTPKPSDLSLVTVTLLKGVIYQDKDASLWGSLLNLQAQVRDFFQVLGLDLVLDEAEGHAFLRSRFDSEDDTEQCIPRLMPRYPLSFQVSLLLALLRRKLAEFDATGGATRLVLTLDEVVEILRVFSRDTSNEARFSDQVEANLKKVEDLGFIKKVRAGAGAGRADIAFEVRRILIPFVDGQWLAEFDDRLAAYQSHINGDGPGKDKDEEVSHD